VWNPAKKVGRLIPRRQVNSNMMMKTTKKEVNVAEEGITSILYKD
jgi:hypothetical protein